MAQGFSKVELRTTDIRAAQAFYHALLGQVAVRVVPLSQHKLPLMERLRIWWDLYHRPEDGRCCRLFLLLSFACCA